MLTPTTPAARAIARFDDRAERLAFALWPGALTLVLPRTPASVDWDLGGSADTIGVRVPDHPMALAVLAARSARDDEREPVGRATGDHL